MVSDVSLHGRVAPKSKSINVEANLLAERLESRARLREQTRKQLSIYFLSTIALCLALPPLYRFQKHVTSEYKAASAEGQKISDRLDHVQKQQNSVKPVIEDKLAIDSVRRHAHEFLGQITLFLNNVDPQVHLSSLTVQIGSSQMEFMAQARAANYRAAANFVSLTAKSPNAKQTILSSMNSEHAIGPEGVTFNLDHKTKVSP